MPTGASSRGRSNVSRLIRIGYGMLSAAERREGLWLALSVMVVAALDMVSVMSIMPLVMLIVEPAKTADIDAFQRIGAMLGAPDIDSLILWFAAAATGLLVIASLANLGLQYWLNSYGSRASARLGKDMMRECLAAPYAWHLTQSAAVLTRIFFSDIQRWGSDFAQRVLMLGHKVLILVLSVVVVLYVAFIAGMVAIIIIGGLVVSLLAVSRPYIIRIADEQRSRSDAIVTASTQCFVGVKDIKLSSREAYFVKLFSDAFTKFSWTRMMLAVWQQVLPTFMLFFGQFGLLVVAVILWRLRLPAGEIAASMALMVLISARLVPALNRIAGDFTAFWNVFPYIENLGELRRTLGEFAARQASGGGAPPKALPWTELRFDAVDFAYRADGGHVLHGVSLTMTRGGAYGVAGPSGAGKSTMVDIMLGLLTPANGAVLVDGRELNTGDLRDWQCGIGYVPQQPFIADDSLRANVAFGVARETVDDADVLNSLEMANIRDFCESLPDGLDTILGDQGKRLSGGQRQRIAIARALYNKPALLVLDEATSSLDTISEEAIKKSILDLRGRITTLTVAHRLSTIRNCDAIFLFDEGRLVDTGDYDALFARSGLFHRLATAAQAPEDETETADGGAPSAQPLSQQLRNRGP